MGDVPRKRCIGPCGQVYDATPEFWHRGNGRYGFHSRCKVCINTYNKDYHGRPEIQKHTQERMKAYYGQPEVKAQYSARSHCYRSRKRSVTGTHTPEQIQTKLKAQKYRCYYCHTRLKKTKGKYIYHIEHTFPLSRVAGMDIPANSIDYLVLACSTCNLSKGNKFPWEWAEGGRLI